MVVGDLMLDVVLAPTRPLETGTDVPGTVSLRQGGSAANTARWLARLGARATLVAAVGRDPAGRALVESVRADGVVARVARVAGARTGRIGVVLGPGGERSFVADRGAADRLRPDGLEAAWFRGADALHMPAYSLLGEPLGHAGRRAVDLARAAGAAVSLDLASIAPLVAGGRRAAVELIGLVRPEILFATAAEADAVLGGTVGRDGPHVLLELAPVTVVKRGAEGATVVALEEGRRLRFEVATAHVATLDSTGAGDAFDAGFLLAWLTGRAAGLSLTAALHRAALAGHRAAARQLIGGTAELPIV